LSQNFADLFKCPHHLFRSCWLCGNSRNDGKHQAKGDLKLGYAYLKWQARGRLKRISYSKEIRVATNVMLNGKRAVGTEVSPEVKTTVLDKGENYYGTANVAGKDYQTAYMPIKNEAARAGEHGKGVAVVADEVRKLADESQASPNMISHLISEIQKEMTHSTNAIKRVREEADQGAALISHTEESFYNIQQSMREMEMALNIYQVHHKKSQLIQTMRNSLLRLLQKA